jgi:2'-5' RNA ligase
VELPAASETALIVPVLLPKALAAFRLETLRDSGSGIPAHVTLLYPFVPPSGLDNRLRKAVAEVVSPHPRFEYALAGPARWSQALYASVEPEAPFRSLHADLAAAFPEYPIYGGVFDFVPHVTIAEGEAAAEPALADDSAWASLPATFTARSVELIVLEGNTWKLRWRFGLRQVPDLAVPLVSSYLQAPRSGE